MRQSNRLHRIVIVLTILAALPLMVLSVQALTWSPTQTLFPATDWIEVGHRSLAVDPFTDYPAFAIYEYLETPDAGFLYYFSWDGTQWISQTVDSGGDVGGNEVLKFDSSANPHIAYYDYSNKKLKYTVWNGSSWDKSIVTSCAYGCGNISLTFDPQNGNPRMAYYDFVAGKNTIYYAVWTGSSWDIQKFRESASGLGEPHLVIDSSGISHLLFWQSGSGMQYASWNQGMTRWDIETIDANTNGNEVSLALDSQDHPHLSYRYDLATNLYQLRYATYNGTQWITTTVDGLPNGNAGGFTSIALDSLDHPHISYEAITNPGSWTVEARHATWTDSAWVTETVILDGEQTSLALDSCDNVHIIAADVDTYEVMYTSSGECAKPSIFVSAWGSGSISDARGSLSYTSADILEWDGTSWSKWFDGVADAGLQPAGQWKHNINAFWIQDVEDQEFVAGFTQNQQKIGDLGWVDGYDLLYWNGSEFSRWFEGELVDLNNKTQEKIDALHVLPVAPPGSEYEDENCDAYLLISTQGPGQVYYQNSPRPNPVLKFSGEDILGFCATNLGVNTTGYWELVMDGSTIIGPNLLPIPKNSVDSISLAEDGLVAYGTVRRQLPLRSLIFAYDLVNHRVEGPLFSAMAEGLLSPVDGLHIVGDLKNN